MIQAARVFVQIYLVSLLYIRQTNNKYNNYIFDLPVRLQELFFIIIIIFYFIPDINHRYREAENKYFQ